MGTLMRLATPEDAEQILVIYAPIVCATIISFESQPPTIDEMQRRIAETLEEFPWVVCERDGRVMGYACATRYRTRPAYQWCVDVSVYVSTEARRQGIGRAAYTSLFEILRLQGFVHAFAGIALPNPASVALHESLGFRSVGTYESVGHKLGGWHDVGWWQLRLQPLPHDPRPPGTLPDVRESADFQAALLAGLDLIHE